VLLNVINPGEVFGGIASIDERWFRA